MAQVALSSRWAVAPFMWRGNHSPTDKKMEGAKMNKNTLKISLRTLIVLMVVSLVAQGVAAQDAATTEDDSNDITGDIGMIGVGLALGLAAIGAGFSQAAIGSAAVGMLAEDGSKFGVALIFTALPESIVILGALPLFLQ
ncbi:MAG: hypothetical protein CBE08_004740 [Euryarchaeota archaeon TMED248]|nr:MAG: hypothetical protein CBE08_004740 [Euryarchaeota archaeon TMED248]